MTPFLLIGVHYLYIKVVTYSITGGLLFIKEPVQFYLTSLSFLTALLRQSMLLNVQALGGLRSTSAADETF